MSSGNQDAYPLSPMQQGMLFHSISAPAADVYLQQLSCRLRGALHVAAFTSAWEELLRRHDVLRTAFAWRGLPEPLQVVGPRVRLPLELLDWRNFDATTQERQLRDLCHADRIAGFDLGRAPLLRLKLIRLSEDEHQFVWTWHHIILDAWSVGIVMDELFALYTDGVRERAFATAAAPRYKEFVAWQRSQDETRAESFWRESLAGFQEPLTIDLGVASSESGYGLEFLELPAAGVDTLREAARRSRLTINTFAQAAWALLLSRHTGSEDVVFGTAVAGRPPELRGVERMVGLLINTIPIRLQVRSSQSLTAWLDDVQRLQAETRRHEHAPLADVQRWSEIPGGSQLFESLLVFENAPLDVTRLQGSGLELVDFDFVERANFPLTVMMEVREQSKVGVGYDRSRFDRPSMLRMLGHFRMLLTQMADAIVAGRDVSLADLDPITDDERTQLLEAWSGGPIAGEIVETSEPISRLFERQVARVPDRPAATFAGEPGDVTLSYRELNERANQCARWLRAQGVSIEDRVALCMEASPLRLIAILGVLKSGAAYVPMEPSVPAARLHEMIADCGARLVLAQPELAAELVGTSQVIALDETTIPADLDATNLETAAAADDLAYVIYTSGSTGRPKGVAVSHRSLHHLVASQICAFHIDADSRVLQFASLSFDASVSEIFTALLAGARLYMAPRQLLVPSRDMMALLERWAITTATFPPSVLSRLPLAELRALQTVVAAGEACPPELVSRWAPGRRFLNAYGPTEVTVCASIAEVRADGIKPAIGKAMGDARVYVLDSRMRSVPIGVAGELYVGGPGVARGYLGRPAQTAASFVPDPFSGISGSRLYRTGDLVRFLTNGDLEFLGRRDEQVKVRGFRIEPGEIETLLRRDPMLREAAVVAEGDSSDDRRLVAYVVAKNRAATDSGRPEWWPSIAEYFVYDELAYHAMTTDERRNDSYRAAIAEKVRDKVVLEVGTGPEALLSRFCAEAGARKVYAIEMLPDSFAKATARVHELGLDDRIEVILGDATKVSLPELADVCVSEIVGAIGGCEGGAVILNGVWHLLKPEATMIPVRSTTLYAPVELPESMLDELAFGLLPARYVEKIFAEVGHPFDLRICAKGLDRSHLLAEPQLFEDLDFRGLVEPDVRHRGSHRIARTGKLDGFLVWLTLDTGVGEKIDILEHEHCWLPVFLPLHGGRIDVAVGDSIEALAGAVLCDGLHPDYFIEGTLSRRDNAALPFRIDTARHGEAFRATPFYERLFANGEVPRLRTQPAQTATLDVATLKQRLRRDLPEHMIPESFVQLEQLPLMPSGKLDRRGLPKTTELATSKDAALVPPRSEAERGVARIWQELLNLDDVGLQTNFFDHGGHSLLLLRVQDRVKADLGIDVSVTDLFKYPTVESLAQRLSQRSDAPKRDDAQGHKRAAARQQALGRLADRRQSRAVAGDDAS